MSFISYNRKNEGRGYARSEIIFTAAIFVFLTGIDRSSPREEDEPFIQEYTVEGWIENVFMPVLYDGEDENGNPSYSWGVASYIVWRGVAFDIGLVGPYEITGMFTNYFGESYMITASLNSAPDYDGWWTGITPTSRFTEGLKCLEVFTYGQDGYPSEEAATAAAQPVKEALDDITAGLTYTAKYLAYVDTKDRIHIHIDYPNRPTAHNPAPPHTPEQGNDPDVQKVNPNFSFVDNNSAIVPVVTMPAGGLTSDYPFINVPENAPNITKPRNRLNLWVWATDAHNQPLANQRFALRMRLANHTGEYTHAEGGHLHYPNRPLGTVTYGSVATAVTINEANGVYNGLPVIQTNANGKCLIKYDYPSVGGIVAFELVPLNAQDAADPNVKGETKYLLVGLQDLAYISGSDTIKRTQGDSRHALPENTYANRAVAEALPDIVKSFLKDRGFYNEETKVYSRHLLINDFALRFGGLFDCENDWVTPHATHRAGWEADFNTCNNDGTDAEAYWIKDTKNVEEWKIFLKLIQKQFPDAYYATNEFPADPDLYFHVYFYGSAVYKEGTALAKNDKFREEVSE